MNIVRIAYIVAFVIAGVTLLAAMMGPVIMLPLAAIPILAGIGIVRRRVWSAYGYALIQAAQLAILPILVIRSGRGTQALPEVAVGAAFTAGMLALFILAGRSLEAAGAERGRAVPWIAVSCICTLPLLFVQPFVIPTGAMEDTIRIGDHILVQRLPKPRPARDDIVVFVYPVDRHQVFVKRIIGRPGDRIRISNKAVYRNGEAIQELYAGHKTDYVDSYRDNFPSEPNVRLYTNGQEMLEKHVVRGEVVVPEGRYFVMGDNRDSSLDSRYWGFIAADDVIGKPLLIYHSEARDDTVGSRRIRWNRLLKSL